MATVIDFKTRAKTEASTPPSAVQQGSRYNCGRCRAETFTLLTSGGIKCSECEVQVNNLMTQYLKGGKNAK